MSLSRKNIRDTAVIVPGGTNKRKELLSKVSKRPNEAKKKVDQIPDSITIPALTMTKEQAWEGYQIVSDVSLKREDKQKREYIIQFLMCDIGPAFYFVSRTLEHTMKLLDIFLSRKMAVCKSSRKKPVFPQRQVLLLDLVTCLFMCCKYNQIYPPTLVDIIIFCQGEEWKIRAQDILDNELEVFKSIELNMNVALVSDWWAITNQKSMPCWAYLCYLDFDLKDKSKFIFEEITRFINHLMESPYKDDYLRFVQKSEKSWGVKEGSYDRKKVFSTDCYLVYDAFVQFRLKNELSKMILLRSSHQIQKIIEEKLF